MNFQRLGKEILPAKVLFWLRSARERYWDAQRFGEIYNKYASHLPSPPSRLSSPERLVLFYPDTPGEGNVAYKLCALLGYGITRVPDRNFDVAFKRRDTTHFNPDELHPLSDQHPIINKSSIDISKKRVNYIFDEIFGYNISVNPRTYKGKAVVKSNNNASHDGEVVTCPIPDSNYSNEKVYQKEIDNRTKNNMVIDYRVPVYGKMIPLVYHKYRPYENRFSNYNSYVYISDPEVTFSKNELENITAFASMMGIDYGELDILRDNNDGRIYIVDANNTPSGPPNGLTDVQECLALHRMVYPFNKLLNKFHIRNGVPQ